MGNITLLRNALGAAALLVAVTAGLTAPATAAPVITGGATTVDLTAAEALAGLGLAVDVLGTGTLDPSGPTGAPRATFAITGGSATALTGGDLLIQHNGSGLSLANATTTVRLENFLIDTNNGKLLGNVTVDGALLGILELFDIGTGLSLALAAQAGAALASVFGIPNLTGTVLGVASTDPIVTPAPAAALLMAPALGLLGYLRARSRRAA
jgi:hypothetical protein